MDHAPSIPDNPEKLDLPHFLLSLLLSLIFCLRNGIILREALGR